MPHRRKLLLVVLSVLSTGFAAAAEAPDWTTVYIVRHAEKVDHSADAALSVVGRQRAATLAWMLRDVAFDAAFSTPFQRTRDTIAPVAKRAGLTIDTEVAPQHLARHLRERCAGQTVIVAGHSNTVPELLAALGVARPEGFLEGYDDLFIVTWPASGGPAHRLHLHYPGGLPAGEAEGEAAAEGEVGAN